MTGFLSSSSAMHLYLILPTIAGAAWLVARYFVSEKYVLPPGPPADPILGHLRLIPQSGQDMFFYELGKKYGDVVYLRVLNKNLIILNTVKAASDLLEKRSSNYSDRPMVPIYDLMGLGGALPFLRYGEKFRIQRKMIQQYLTKDKVKNFRHVHTREARRVALALATCPCENLMKTFLTFSTASIIDITYGHQVTSASDPYIQIVSECGDALAKSGPPGATPVDFFPILCHLPWWFPGTYYATFARKASAKFRALMEYPYNEFIEQAAKGAAKPSFIASLLEDLRSSGLEGDPRSIKQVQAVSSVTYLGGADTTASMLTYFILAMVLYPECVKKAQEELDRIVGTDRLPEYGDREDLHYLECVFQETLRWNSPAPSGGPHMAMEDDDYNGMFIPKGSTIIANTRSMSLDESLYSNPSEFDPERFLPAPLGRDEPYTEATFGFGRRKCPGRHLANESAWIAIATIMATMTIERERDEDGAEIVPNVKIVAEGVTSHPWNFPCQFVPRPHALKILKNHVDAAL